MARTRDKAGWQQGAMCAMAGASPQLEKRSPKSKPVGAGRLASLRRRVLNRDGAWSSPSPSGQQGKGSPGALRQILPGGDSLCAGSEDPGGLSSAATPLKREQAGSGHCPTVLPAGSQRLVPRRQGRKCQRSRQEPPRRVHACSAGGGRAVFQPPPVWLLPGRLRCQHKQPQTGKV